MTQAASVLLVVVVGLVRRIHRGIHHGAGGTAAHHATTSLGAHLWSVLATSAPAGDGGGLGKRDVLVRISLTGGFRKAEQGGAPGVSGSYLY